MKGIGTAAAVAVLTPAGTKLLNYATIKSMIPKILPDLLACLILLVAVSCQPAGADFQELPNYQSPTPKTTATSSTTAQEGKGPTPSTTTMALTLPPTPVATITLVAGLVVVGGDNSPAGNPLNPSKITPATAGGGAECKTCPTLSPTATITPTATISGTTQPTATPTLLPASGPIFPNTPVLTFEPQLFITQLITVRDTFGNFVERWNPVLDGSRLRQQGDCEAYVAWYHFWTTAPAFHDVPAGWQSLYYEYRVKLLDAANKTNFVRDICPAVEPDPNYNGRIQVDITGFFNIAYPRLQEMITEAQTLFEE